MESGAIAVMKARVALDVTNVERSIEFYKRMLGLEPCKVRTGSSRRAPAAPVTLRRRS